MQLLETQRADLDIEVLWGKAEQPVADAATHQPRPATGLADGIEHGTKIDGQLHRLTRCTFPAGQHDASPAGQQSHAAQRCDEAQEQIERHITPPS
jgi:hypothetical protein